MQRVSMVKEYTSILGDTFKVHVITVKNGNKRGGSYRQIRAKEGMIERSHDRWFDHWYQKKLTTHHSLTRFDRWTNADDSIYIKARERMAKREGVEVALENYPTYEVVEHDSVWDFFDHIGYDHKNKKVSNIDSLLIIKERE
tara:strand:- start:19081 stop:19506 length:426 start_codon:yes stop_codon:yes gene_type:complete